MYSKLPLKNKIETGKSIKIAPFRKDIRKTEPHKHNNYFEIIYLSKGKGFHTIDSQQYQVNPPVVFIVRKEQVHHWELNDVPDGFVLILKKSFVDTSLDKELKNLLTQVSAFSCILLQDEKIIEQLFNMLVQEYQSELNSNMPITEGLLKALLAKILQMAKPVQPTKRKTSNLFLDFREILGHDKTLKNSIAYYARLLKTTPQNLNAACRKAVDQSAAEILSEFIISEAKRLLLYTDMTVAEISLSLEFKDNSHFIKYFKRHTGNTPQSFRSIA
ncbi:MULTISPECIES: AraC family transcriptional regulator [Niastella]|uniref:Helix-turn-helix domain-containing protein n=1 Tax=Niastella soli TaxID=2821487 RepID=A0ABS3YXG4_9BACT|nr:helix-turn-helix domain-containing protein [Niastella soli]MBO9202610.1 helix-turn-helix domain-containing protein [Niastella soli]